MIRLLTPTWVSPLLAVPPRPVRRAGRSRRWVTLAASGSYLLAGCYTYVPVSSAPAAGTQIGLDISDQGRVALGERLGAGVTRIEGTLTDAGTDEFVVAVKSVSQINAGRVDWSGESVRLRREYVVRSQERKFSRGRTALVVGGIAAAIVAAVLTRSLVGNGGSTTTEPGGVPGDS